MLEQHVALYPIFGFILLPVRMDPLGNLRRQTFDQASHGLSRSAHVTIIHGLGLKSKGDSEETGSQKMNARFETRQEQFSSSCFYALRSSLPRYMLWTQKQFSDANPVPEPGQGPHLFHHKGEPIGDFRKAFDAACAAAGLQGILPHDLRRSAVRNFIRAGVKESVAMRLSGHRTRSVFDRYNIVSEDDLVEANEKVLAFLCEAIKESKIEKLKE
jgi:hypothetical protein